MRISLTESSDARNARLNSLSRGVLPSWIAFKPQAEIAAFYQEAGKVAFQKGLTESAAVYYAVARRNLFDVIG
jgi:hypothetical protein